MDLQKLKTSGTAAWNAAGKFIELFAVLVLVFLRTLLDALRWVLTAGIDWIEAGHPIPAWMKPGKPDGYVTYMCMPNAGGCGVTSNHHPRSIGPCPLCERNCLTPLGEVARGN